MFNKLYFKFALWSIIFVFIILIISSAISCFSISFFSFKRFEKEIFAVSELVERDLKNISNVLSEDITGYTQSIIEKYIGYLGINENRSVFILNNSNF